MIRWIVPLMLLLDVVSAQAADLKLVSELCDHSHSLRSTGYLFKSGEEILVLASADFVFDSESSTYCHAGVDDQGRSYPLKLLKYDWATGLALLQAPAELASVATPFNPAPAKLLEKAVWGNLSGVVVASHSQRHHWPKLGEVLEIKGSQTSVAAVGTSIRAPSGEILGFVGSQWIEEVPGSGSRVVRWLDRSAQQTSEVLAIPATAVSAWLSDSDAADWKPLFGIRPENQLAKKYAFTFGPVTFAEDCPPPDSHPGEDPNYPIGGGDPVGIGGATLAAPACNFTVAMENQPGSISAAHPLAEREPWLQKLTAYLGQNLAVTVKTSYHRDENQLLQSSGAVSLGNLGQILIRPEFGFMLGLTGDHAPQEPRLADLRKKSRRLLAEVARPWGLMSVRQRAYLYGGLSLTDDWPAVTMADLQALYADAFADSTALIYISQDVQDIISARKAIAP